MTPTPSQVLITAVVLFAAAMLAATTNAGAAWAAFGFTAYHIARMTPRPGEPTRKARGKLAG